MKRFHVHVSVADLQQSIRFYSTLFGSEPAVIKDDYAKWMLDDPRVNFAISQRGAQPGLNHLGLQTDSDAELETLNARMQQAELATVAENEVACCYARSNKYWVTDPAGIAWETFHTLGSVPTFDGAAAAGPAASQSAAQSASQSAARSAAPAGCCGPADAKAAAKIPVTSATACCG